MYLDKKRKPWKVILRIIKGGGREGGRKTDSPKYKKAQLFFGSGRLLD